MYLRFFKYFISDKNEDNAMKLSGYDPLGVEKDYWAEETEPNWLNQTDWTKLTEPNWLNLTERTWLTEPSLQKLTNWT